MKKINKIFITAICSLIGTAPIFASTPNTGIERYAIYIGSNFGGKNNDRLLYADTDAISFQKTMAEIGGVSNSNGILLLNPTKDEVDTALSSISDAIQRNKNRATRSEFIFYYSGHSDENALLLGKTVYSYATLKNSISSVPSDVHVVILDSCYSGNFIRSKGGKRNKPFLIDDSSVVKGHAYLSSSSSQEFSQESDEIGSSFFTNSMITGLRGAADSSGDKKVTLNELYSYAFSETLSKTETSAIGPQHPNFNITLVGSGDLVLSDISESESMLKIAKDVEGTIIIRTNSGKLISEIHKNDENPIYMALESGNYQATIITNNKTLQGDFSLSNGNVYVLSESDFSEVARLSNRTRGSSDDSKQYVKPRFNFDGAASPSKMNDINQVSFLSLGLLGSADHIIKGAQVSTIYGFANTVYGAQASGIFNIGKTIYGGQAAGIFNKSENILGVQEASCFNIANTIRGIQAAGLFNSSINHTGGQIAGIFNFSTDVNGIQFAGIANSTSKMLGVQSSGILNVAKNIKGAQLSGIMNIANKSEGVQIGLINFAKESSGISLGLINIILNGVLEQSASYTSEGNIALAFRSGTKRLYSIIEYEAEPRFIFRANHHKDNWYDLLSIGLGTRIQANIFNFDFEGLITAVNLKDNDENDSGNSYPSVRIIIGCTPIPHFNIFGGAKLSYRYDDWNEEAFLHQDKNMRIHIGSSSFYPEFEVGMKIKL